MLKQEFLDVKYIIDETYKNILKAAPTGEFDSDYTSVKVYLNEMRSYLHELKAHDVDLLTEETAGHSLISHFVFDKLPVALKRELVHRLSNSSPTLTDIFCQYFGSKGHSLGKCSKFPKYEDKVERLRDLSLCTRCAGSGHVESACYGKQNKLKFACQLCKKREHLTSLCPLQDNKSDPRLKTSVSLCLAQRSLDSSKMLPTMTLNLRNGKKGRKVRCLIDTGSQRSYISETAAKDLCQDVSGLHALECEVGTYLGQETREFKQMSTGIKLEKRLVFVPLLVDRTLNITFEVPGMNEVINIFKNKNIGLLDETFYLSPQTKTTINLVMDPLKSYFNSLEHILEDSEVDNGLEHLFSSESMGIKKDDRELLSFDKDQIDEFKEGITFKDRYYNVELPWYPDKIKSVPSNKFVALKVLDRTVDHLKRKGLINKYQEVFDKQLEDGIIEEIKVKPSDYDKYVWIPHRPVIKMEEQVTTKIRPVFNCSLKTNKELPSLNEAAYPGIDLMGSILKLLFYFRTNKTVMLSDIKPAFLMVKLKNEADQNKFCFWRRGDKLVAYRYKSIVFGYIFRLLSD
ncbi:uncharacterized protein LOC126980939 [Eriocheir sinensis]|uniref:uncharacterized protein LOC126980939 n=1 Tax=Eriocheir sinensis TaxID=95602 RepID=UPI0021C68164|nr:uncharacterized protein LOC126980939 [Eriocheir sinensis]